MMIKNGHRGVSRALALLGVAAGLAWMAACQSLAPAQSGGGRPSPCVRHEPVGYWSVAGEMTQTYLRCHGHPACPLIQVETKRIAGNSMQIPQWLWSNSSQNHTFTVAQQDGFIATAKQIGVTHAPPGKMIAGISFFHDMIPAMQNSMYFLGADITYAVCGSDNPHQ